MFKKEAYYYDLFHNNKNYKKEAINIKKQFPKAKTILEIGSGTGLMTKELVKLGFKVTSIEPSRDMRIVAYNNKRIGYKILDETIESYYEKKKFDLVLALYDVLNYVSFNNINGVLKKIDKLGKGYFIQMWGNEFVWPITYKKRGKCSRLRLGFKWKKRVYLWYIYWGNGFFIEKHNLYIHE